MKNIDRLIIKAKKKCGVDRLVLAFIYPSETEPGKWIARGDIWNGIPYGKSGHKLEFATCICDSVDDALQALDELAEKHPNNKDVQIIIDDLEEGG